MPDSEDNSSDAKKSTPLRWDVETVIKLAKGLGISTVLLGFVIWGIRSSFIWGAPILQELAHEHITFLRESTRNNETIAGSVVRIDGSIERQAENGHQLVEITKANQLRTEEIAKQVNEVHRVIVRPKTEEK